MPGKILTRDEYLAALVRFMPEARRLADERRAAITDVEMIDLAMARWDEAAKEYGPCDLTTRDQDFEAACETVDEPAWIVIGIVRRARRL